MSLTLDMDHVLRFLDMLDHNGRHTIASEAPFGSKDGGPLWERGNTYEADERAALIKDIRQRQARSSNVYYSVNRPCPAEQRIGANGKNNIDDIIAVRALAFDIDIIKRPFDNARLLSFIDKELTGALRPSLLISTGGGYHLIYLLENSFNIAMFRPATNVEQKTQNDELLDKRQKITQLAHDFEFNLRITAPAELNEYIKIDNMSNVDRVMRLPGTVNYPKLEKKNKGQVEALAHIYKDYQHRTNIKALRDAIPGIDNVRNPKNNGPFIRKRDPNSKYGTPYKMALYLCEQIRDRGLADSNETYTLWVMLPLIGMIHDENNLTIEEGRECFMEAICGGDRYGSPGRGAGYFMRQWKSHRPEIGAMGLDHSAASSISARRMASIFRGFPNLRRMIQLNMIRTIMRHVNWQR